MEQVVMNNNFLGQQNKKKEEKERTFKNKFDDSTTGDTEPKTPITDPNIPDSKNDKNEDKSPYQKEKEKHKNDRQFSLWIPKKDYIKFRLYSEIKGIPQKDVALLALQEYLAKIDDDELTNGLNSKYSLKNEV